MAGDLAIGHDSFGSRRKIGQLNDVSIPPISGGLEVITDCPRLPRYAGWRVESDTLDRSKLQPATSAESELELELILVTLERGPP